MDRVAHLWPDISELVAGPAASKQTFLAWRTACCYTRASTLKRWHLKFSDKDTLPVIRFNLIHSRLNLIHSRRKRVPTKYPPPKKCSQEEYPSESRFPPCLYSNTGVAAARRGDLAVCQFLLTLYPPPNVCVVMLYNAVDNGHLHVCEFLKTCRTTSGTTLTVQDVRKHSGNSMLSMAVAKNFVHICKFLKDLGMTLYDVRTNENGFSKKSYVLPNAVMRGRLPMLQFLREWRDCVVKENGRTASDTEGSMLTIQDVRAHNDEALRLAAERGHVHVIQFLMDWCKDLASSETELLTLDHVRAFGSGALVDAAERGDVATFKYFKSIGLTLSNIRFPDLRNILWCSAECGHLNVLQFLKKEFLLTVDDLRALDNYEIHCMRKANKHGHTEVAQFLQDWYREKQQ